MYKESSLVSFERVNLVCGVHYGSVNSFCGSEMDQASIPVVAPSAEPERGMTVGETAILSRKRQQLVCAECHRRKQRKFGSDSSYRRR